MFRKQVLDANVTSLIQRLDTLAPSSSQQSLVLRNDPGRYRSTAMAEASPTGRSGFGRYILATIVLLIGSVLLGLYLHYWHQTGLRPEPPSGFGIAEEEALRDAMADRAAFLSGW
jgi:hypothetical protein